MRNPVVWFTLLLLSCTTAPVEEELTEEIVVQSTIDIRYQMGQSQYRFLANSGEEASSISSFRDDQQLENRLIPLAKYRELFQFIEARLSLIESIEHSEGCKTPFSLMLINRREHRTFTGCRSMDSEGVLGQILNQGEVLFFSVD